MNRFDDALQKMIGSYAWHVRKGFGSFLTVEFGSPYLIVREPKDVLDGASIRVKETFSRRAITVAGEWHLWIQECDWIVRTRQHKLFSGIDHQRSEIDLCLEQLDGQILLRADFDENKKTLELTFDLGGSVSCSARESASEDELWSIHHRSGRVIAVASAARDEPRESRD